ncbi:hypothetical protein I1A62_00735 (plasmid) [Rhodococcus sp. USK10]|uniref:hypothetical protein n=1 Tax=Rhodococcus sp. USK10 TaxID=2789739 RepID=UPI001C5EF0A8|nr:hypothetical protein [Rhodococcus sp. USK10]QYA99744.1 hypothetical protein I1A62_00735 [Rhodococcus sp. USK10]
MTRATEKARTLERVQWAFVAVAGACAVLHLVFGAWWWYLAMVFAAVSVVAAIFHVRVVRRGLKASRSFRAVGSTDSQHLEG